MELKKAPQADLENERATFFLLGFTVVLSLLFILLEWSSEDTLPPEGLGVPLLTIESEYVYNEAPAASPAEPEAPVNDAHQVVHEGYTVVEEPPVEETKASDAEEMPATDVPETPLPNPSDDEPTANEPPVIQADVMPQYPGGYAAMNRYLFDHLKYPASALSQRIEGRVWCSFIVDKEGALADIRIEKGVYVSLDQEALRVLQTMPTWIPGSVRGNPVRVKVYLPIVFKL
ncbi:MAG: TonB family protein [Dysgonamonadaceae bacterium]|jgi:protein TonB|nr:TonB family protein [Dysgonamonadaceae bacterium]